MSNFRKHPTSFLVWSLMCPAFHLYSGLLQMLFRHNTPLQFNKHNCALSHLGLNSHFWHHFGEGCYLEHHQHSHLQTMLSYVLHLQVLFVQVDKNGGWLKVGAACERISGLSSSAPTNLLPSSKLQPKDPPQTPMSHHNTCKG